MSATKMPANDPKNTTIHIARRTRSARWRNHQDRVVPCQRAHNFFPALGIDGGRKRLDRARAEQAIRERIAEPLRLDVQEAASGIYEIVTAKRGLSRPEALSLIESMPVLVANHDFIKSKWNEADDMIDRRDKSDVPLVALALSIEVHDGIWSTDKDFDAVRGRFKVWKTRELVKA